MSAIDPIEPMQALPLEDAPDNGLLRFLTCGSVDDGKSTLIGRLLYDSKTILADTLHAMQRTSEKRGLDVVDLSLLTDGLQAEREQGITIDVAYRYFTTGTRKYIIADAPGHEQYTRNMVTAASTADLAIILIDARKGVLAQTRRHSYIAHLLGIPQVVVAVNKMDLVDYSPEIFARIKADYLAFAGKLGIENIRFMPMSALHGDMIVERGDATRLVRPGRASSKPSKRCRQSIAHTPRNSASRCNTCAVRRIRPIRNCTIIAASWAVSSPASWPSATR
jgi:sulfate adenylyltransferase subunit 1